MKAHSPNKSPGHVRTRATPRGFAQQKCWVATCARCGAVEVAHPENNAAEALDTFVYYHDWDVIEGGMVCPNCLD